MNNFAHSPKGLFSEQFTCVLRDFDGLHYIGAYSSRVAYKHACSRRLFSLRINSSHCDVRIRGNFSLKHVTNAEHCHECFRSFLKEDKE